MTADARMRLALAAVVDSCATPGVAIAASRNGRWLFSEGTVVAGALASIGPDGVAIARADRQAVTAATRYDLASVTKLYSAVTILGLVDSGVLDLDAPIGTWLPEYRSAGRSGVTLRHLLSHVSGLPASWEGWHRFVDEEGTADARWSADPREVVLSEILASPLLDEPGQVYRYSCLGYITAMAVAETATGQRWDELVTAGVLRPLGLHHTTFGPVAVAAPTEYTLGIGRGLVEGSVHDETAFALGGISANAGLFAPASDLLRFGEALLDGLPGILGSETECELWTDQLPRYPADRPDWGQAIGLRIGQENWMTGHLPAARGHTGFTGPSLLLDRESGLVVALVTNRVHPSRSISDGNLIRTTLHRAVLDRAD